MQYVNGACLPHMQISYVCIKEQKHKEFHIKGSIRQKTAVSIKLSPLTSLTRCTERCFPPSSPDHSVRDSSAVMERSTPACNRFIQV